jgi:hypothetical protein
MRNSIEGDLRRSGTYEQKGNRAWVLLVLVVEETWVLMRAARGVESRASPRPGDKKT